HCWDLATGKDTHQLRRHQARVEALAISRDGKTLATGSWGGTIQLWDLATGKETLALPTHEGSAVPLGFLPDGRTLLGGSGQGVPCGPPPRPARPRAPGTVREQRRLPELPPPFALSPDGKTLLGTESYGKVYLWDAVEGVELAKLGESNSAEVVTAFSPDGREVALGRYHQLLMHDTATGRPRPPLQLGHGLISGAAFSA